jgi:hypothetical protein
MVGGPTSWGTSPRFVWSSAWDPIRHRRRNKPIDPIVSFAQIVDKSLVRSRNASQKRQKTLELGEGWRDTSWIISKNKRPNMQMINPLPIPLPLNRNPRPRKSIIDIHTINIHGSPLLTPIGLVAEGDGEPLVRACLDEACCSAGFGVDVRDVFGEGEACFSVVDGGLEAVVDGHCGGVGEGRGVR